MIGFDVIIEGILSKHRHADPRQKLIEEFDGNAFIYYFDISFEETLRRHSTKPNKNEFGEAEMRKWWNENDYLGLPNEKTISERMSENDIVETIFKDITLTGP